MTTRERIGIAVAGVLVATIVLLPELFAGGWHLLHGNSVRFRDWSIPVPRGWYAVARGEGVALERMQRFNFWRTPPSALFLPVHFAKSFHPDLGAFEAQQSTLLAAQGFLPSVRRGIVVNGKPGRCWEYTASGNADKLWVACFVPDELLSMDYRGPRKYLWTAYRALAAITPAPPAK